ncbi:MAG: hypothetical protein JNL36_04460 [Candidatus Kapabacteria bacterium]|nr:hypothetical protein [Candidatus Kapabacteria bacterium]
MKQHSFSLSKTTKELLVLLFVSLSCMVVDSTPLFAQGTNLDNTGAKNLTNSGTIRIKNGQVKALPDSIGGRVEFKAKVETQTQRVPTIIFNQLEVSGKAQKSVEALPNSLGQNNPLITRDSLVIIDSTTFSVDQQYVSARSWLKNTAKAIGSKYIMMEGTAKQTVEGNGEFDLLGLNNSEGAAVVNGGGFKVKKELLLNEGALQNSQQNNLTIGDSATIIRNIGSIESAPIFEKTANVRYINQNPLITGEELPVDTLVLQKLSVENTGSITLNRSVTVNDSLRLQSNIFTYFVPDTTTYVLTYTSENHPQFTTQDAEVAGSMKRTKLTDSTVFNNRYTYIIFENPAERLKFASMKITSKPNQFHIFPLGDQKIKRTFAIEVLDGSNQILSNAITYTFGYGWKHRMADPIMNEDNNLNPFESLRLQNWTGNIWGPLPTSEVPKLDPSGWGYSVTRNMQQTGFFAVGLDIAKAAQLAVKFYLEGPYRNGSMALDLRENNTVPKRPPNIYPYNLDPLYSVTFVNNVPDSVVDWVVIELRNDNVAPDPAKSIYRTGFLRYDGKVVDLNGQPIVIINFDETRYFVAVHHRNHLAVTTSNSFLLFQQGGNQTQIPIINVDLTNGQGIFGGNSSLKPIDRDELTGALIFGLYSGDVNGDRSIDKADFDLIWQSHNIEGYFNVDTDLNGISITKDFNVSWNNRYKTSLVKP